MFDWVDILEGKLDSMSPVGTDLETVKQQIVELKVDSWVFCLPLTSVALLKVTEASTCFTSWVFVGCFCTETKAPASK